MQNISLRRLALSGAVALALATSLSACSGGGGGGMVKPSPAPPIPAPPAPPVPPPAPPAPPAPPPAPAHSYPADNHLVPTGAFAAQAKGFTGKGVKVGVLDSGIEPSLAPFKGRVASFASYIDNGSNTPNDAYGHGSVVAQIIGGSVTPDFHGGIAPDAGLYIAQVCENEYCTAYQKAYDDLSAQGVHLFNQSFGFYDATANPVVAQQIVDEYLPLINKGDLFVWSAGNEGPNKLNFEASVPATRPELQKGWLVAVNVQINSAGEPTTLDPTSAVCGVAKDWCLAAPGTTQFTPLPSGPYTTGLADGTSGSAAVVTGVAAQVWQAFPWMSGTDVQQTILTTATPMGGSAPNATYGWGLVNADKAVDGPGKFAFGAFEADVGRYHATFSNPISGKGSLVLEGTSGSLTLAADNAYTGGTTVNSSRLIISGSVASDVTMLGGELVGQGTIHGDLFNTAGTIASLNDKQGGGLHVAGNYTAEDMSKTVIGIGSPLKVDGAAALAGTLEIAAAPDSYTPKATETLLQSSRLTGTFGAQIYGGGVFYKATLKYGNKDLTADLVRTAVSQSVPMTMPTVANTAKGLDSALHQADTWSTTDYEGHSAFLDTAAKFLTARTQSQAIASIRSLDGEIYGTAGAIEAEQSSLVDDALALRQNRVGTQGGLWVQALTANGALSQDGFSSARYHSNGFLAGAEAPISSQFSAGFALGRSYLDASLNGLSGRVRGQQNTLGLYGRYAFANDAYMAGRLSWSNEHLDISRTAMIGDTFQAIAGTRTDKIARASLEIGKAFDVGPAVLTPYLAVSQLRINQSGFTEGGAQGFGLTAQSQHQNATMGDLGVRFGHSFAWTGGTSVLSGYAAYRRVFTGESLDLTASLSGAPGSNFTVLGQSMARNTGRVGVNLSTMVNTTWDWFLNADAQAARGRSHGLSASAGIRFHF